MNLNIWRQRYLALVVFLIPWQARWIFGTRELGIGASEYTTLSLYMVDVLMLVGIAWGWPFRMSISRIKEVSYRLAIALGVILVVLLGNIFMSVDISSSLLKFFTITLFSFFVIVVIKFGSPHLSRLAVVLSASLQASFGLYQFLNQEIIASTYFGMSEQLPSLLGSSVVETETGRWLRAYGSFPHPNILGGFLSLSLLLVIDWYFLVYEKFQKWWDKNGIGNNNLWQEPIVKKTGIRVSLLLVASVIISSGIFVTFSRGAVVAAIVSLGLYFIGKYWSNKIRATALGIKLLTAIFLTVAMWQFIFPGIWDTRLSLSGRLETQSTNERLTGYKDAVNIIHAYPLLGTGISAYVVALEANYPNLQSYFYQPTHNVLFLVYAEIGLLGLIVVGWGLWLARFKMIKKFLESPIVFSSLVGFIIILILSDHYLWSLHAGLLLWVVMFASFSSKRDQLI